MMMIKTRHLLFSVARQFWLVYGIFLWYFWLASVPFFWKRTAAGTLPTVEVERATAGAAAWGSSVATWFWINTAVNTIIFLVFSLVAFFIWWRVRTGFGLLTSFVLLLGGSFYLSVANYSEGYSETAVFAWELRENVWVLFLLWVYLFPNGRAVPRRLLWAFALLFTALGVQTLFNILTNFLPQDQILGQVIALFQPIYYSLAFPSFLFVLIAQIYRYLKISGSVERSQTKWFLLALGIFFIPVVLLDDLLDIPMELEAIFFASLPIGIGISILHYHLWDIDVIIRKTLIYAVLSGLLGLIYFGTVVLLQNVVTAVTGQQSAVTIVVSTLVIAALFSPLRQRVQDFIDRRFFRKKYDAQKVLAHFSQTARDKVSLEALTAELTSVVRETMQPETVSIWLKKR
jgi:hypothetical protein